MKATIIENNGHKATIEKVGNMFEFKIFPKWDLEQVIRTGMTEKKKTAIEFCNQVMIEIY